MRLSFKNKNTYSFPKNAFGFFVTGTYKSMIDKELNNVILEIKSHMPNASMFGLIFIFFL